MLNNKSDSTPPGNISLGEVDKSGPCSEHIVCVFDAWFCADSRCRIFRTFIKLQQCDGTLEDYLAQSQRKGYHIELLDLIEIMIQILSGVCDCYQRKLCYQDLKESNSISFVSKAN